MSKKRRARARGEEGVEKQKIRVEGIRTRMEIEWFRREQDREREREREREKERIRVSGKCTRAPVSTVPGVE